MLLSHRERVIKTLRHQEPDRIPFDLGGTMCSSIHVAGYQKLKAHFGDRLSFWGGIDTQRVLPNGTPEEVKAEVRRRIRDLAPGGGYVLAAVHNIQPDVPVENILAMFEAGREYGRYPINL
ncbi:MAG: uroporphyrinogen decarboxylase family protein [Dehalococcoidales bacterium]|nr:uroporphyrinogen decarboxylase family protein [Dehalococcoidales bacterium]